MPLLPNPDPLSRFRTSRGELSQYALECGYIQTHESNGERVTLWHEGGPCYHVRHFDDKERRVICWLSFESLTEARVRYRQFKRAIKAMGRANGYLPIESTYSDEDIAKY